jgi:hypothetical protein
MTNPSGILEKGRKEEEEEEKIPKIVAYLTCATGRMHFAQTKIPNTHTHKWYQPHRHTRGTNTFMREKARLSSTYCPENLVIID